MPAATFNLTGDSRIEQGAQYGLTFKLRNSVTDHWQLTVSSIGTVGDVFTVDVFGVDSDDPDAAASASYTVQAGDDVAAVAAGIASAAGVLSGVSASSALAVVTLTASALKTYLDVSTAASTVPGNITAVNTGSVLIDLTGASMLAQIRKSYISASVLADLSPHITITDAAHSKFKLLVPASVTASYTWESAFWQLTVALSGADPDRYFEGQVENRLSLMLP